MKTSYFEIDFFTLSTPCQQQLAINNKNINSHEKPPTSIKNIIFPFNSNITFHSII